ncbi:hypothetical protein FB451DRAFT_1413787 [Mycena latifolia]|nr:hypothetical protein FB451DRAFT_1413787 [Mycena latifolia]
MLVVNVSLSGSPTTPLLASSSLGLHSRSLHSDRSSVALALCSGVLVSQICLSSLAGGSWLGSALDLCADLRSLELTGSMLNDGAPISMAIFGIGFLVVLGAERDETDWVLATTVYIVFLAS